jgi:hypothetical protein
MVMNLKTFKEVYERAFELKHRPNANIIYYDGYCDGIRMSAARILSVTQHEKFVKFKDELEES